MTLCRRSALDRLKRLGHGGDMIPMDHSGQSPRNLHAHRFALGLVVACLISCETAVDRLYRLEGEFDF